MGSCSFWLQSVHMDLLNVPRLASVEITHALGCVWCFVVGVVDLLVGSLEETPRETQRAAKSFRPANAFLLVESLLDQQLSAF